MIKKKTIYYGIDRLDCNKNYLRRRCDRIKRNSELHYYYYCVESEFFSVCSDQR